MDEAGKEIRIASLNGYSLTVFSSLAVVERLTANGVDIAVQANVSFRVNRGNA